jgi:hypothetical protein
VAFKGRLLAGVGPVLRLFELGRKKLLRKCEYRQLPQHVAQLHTLGSRIYVADMQVGCGWGRVCSMMQDSAGCWLLQRCFFRVERLARLDNNAMSPY